MENLHIPIKRTLAKKTRAGKFKKILLIDQYQDSVLADALTRAGYDLVQCDSVQKAWSLVYPHRPQLIILRPNDSNGAGLSALQECRALGEGVPIILALSAPVKRALIKAAQHGSAAVYVASSTPQSITEALHHLEDSTIGTGRGAFTGHPWSNIEEG